MEEKTLNLYEKIVKIYFIKKEFADYSSTISNTLNLSVAANTELVEGVGNSLLNSFDPNKGMYLASYMYKNPNFFEFKNSRECIGSNYILAISGEGRNAYLYSQRVGGKDSYCACTAFSDQEKYGSYLSYLSFFREAFILSALAFENGTQEERYNWESLLKNNDYNTLGFVVAKGREYRKELVNNINTYINCTFSAKKIFDKSGRYDRYSIISQGMRNIEEIKIEENLNNNKMIKCTYNMPEFYCYGDIVYRANFERENSFSKNFFPSYVKINSEGEITPEKIDFDRLSNPNLTLKNRKFANEMIMKKLTSTMAERINNNIDKIYSDLAAIYPEEENGKNLLFSKLNSIYSSIGNINKRFNEIIINASFMK